eukprot:151529-Rhodomonas_salina.3
MAAWASTATTCRSTAPCGRCIGKLPARHGADLSVSAYPPMLQITEGRVGTRNGIMSYSRSDDPYRACDKCYGGYLGTTPIIPGA